MRIFKCANGSEYQCPDKACVFCDHCSDIFYDYINGPYLICCDIKDHPDNSNGTCELFTERTDND